ncbi:hypothetical protein ACFKHW_28175 [Bradyrhizobium lupini]|uniref:hypothetical protein n=1 Tax=Rhizobium lupini TaxID=136996 RepID=UPI0036712333
MAEIMVATDQRHPNWFSLLATAASRPGSHALSATLKMPLLAGRVPKSFQDIEGHSRTLAHPYTRSYCGH